MMRPPPDKGLRAGVSALADLFIRRRLGKRARAPGDPDRSPSLATHGSDALGIFPKVSETVSWPLAEGSRNLPLRTTSEGLDKRMQRRLSHGTQGDTSPSTRPLSTLFSYGG